MNKTLDKNSEDLMLYVTYNELKFRKITKKHI